MILTRVFPVAVPGESLSVDLDDSSSRDRLLDLYRPPADAWVRINLIASVSGNAGGSDGTSETLSNPADRRLLGVIRELGDVVLIGAESLRAEGYLLPRRSPLAVVTSSGNLTGHGVGDAVDSGRVIVLCPEQSVARVRETVGAAKVEIVTVPATDGRFTMPDLLAVLRGRGLNSIVCEGGPGLAAQLISANLVDELCLSTSPLLNGAHLPVFGKVQFDEKQLSLTQLMVDNASGIYARWGVIR